MPHSANGTRDADISGLMNVIVGNLMPLCEREANPELWLIYNEMQKWELLAVSKAPLADTREAARTVETIRRHLRNLDDPRLAATIERVLLRHTPHAKIMAH